MEESVRRRAAIRAGAGPRGCRAIGIFVGAWLVLGLTGCRDAPLSPVTPCVDGETQPCTVPPCPGPGVQQCVEGEWGPCEGYQTPREERCNGRDDSCNGLIDDNPQDPEIGEPCGTDVGRCRKGEVRCIGGELTCFGAIEPRAERCNGLDDDCDGIVDNNVPEELCYTGPPETRGVGICRSGIERCVGGEMVCEFEQLPEPFDCTNGLDNTCDGQIDHADGRDIDVVLFVDWSGSMIRTLPDVKQGLVTFLNLLRDSHRVRIATVVFPDQFNDGHCALEHGFLTPGEAIEYVNRLEIKRVGIEPSYQCLYDAARNVYELSYREGADRIFVLFTDEPNFNNQLTQEDVAEKMNENDAEALFFIDPLFQHHYDVIVELTDGVMEDLAGGDLGQRLLSRMLTQTCDP